MTKSAFLIPFLSSALTFALLGQIASAGAADLPKRKAGLWEFKTQMAGKPSRGAIQQCIDANTDDLMQQRAAKEGASKCATTDVKHQGNTVVIHSVCKMEGITTTSDAVITGSFDSGYRNEMTVRYDPPMVGMTGAKTTQEAKITQEAKWLGPCKAGQKPGDVIMPGMGTFNVQDPEKNRKQMEEMMKHRQGK
jgi:hypothetical protein